MRQAPGGRVVATVGLAVGLIAACSGGTPPIASPSPTGSASASPSASASASPIELITFPPSPSTSAGPPGSASASASASPSESASGEPSATPTEATAQIIRFRREGFVESGRNQVDCTRPDFNNEIHLAWEIRNATGATISIDGPGPYASYSGLTGEADVPFTCDPLQHTYTLTTIGGLGTNASETRTIRVAQPKIADFAVIGPNCPNTTDLVPVSVTWQVANATGVEVWVDGELHATYDGKQSPAEGADAGTFDCSQSSQAYRLVTTGGYGTPDTQTLDAVP